MRTAHENVVHDAPPLFLRTPSVVLLWIATLVGLVSLLALSRVRMPRADRDDIPRAIEHWLLDRYIQRVMCDSDPSHGLRLGVEPCEELVEASPVRQGTGPERAWLAQSG
jgi:hypothetical protein